MDYVPTAQDFEAARVTNAAQSEVIRQRLYDSLLYPAAGVAQLSFFSSPPGQGVTTAAGAVVGSSKTVWDTNLEVANTLPSGKAYMIESIEIDFKPGSVSTANTYTAAATSLFAVAAAAAVAAQSNDVNSFYQSGLVELNILSKNYLREHTQAFPPKASLDVTFGVASATDGMIAAGWAKAVGRPYYVQPQITLQPAVNFEIVLRYPAAVPMPSGFNGRVCVYLDGYVMRASQ